jgi:hypothetical protein
LLPSSHDLPGCNQRGGRRPCLIDTDDTGVSLGAGMVGLWVEDLAPCFNGLDLGRDHWTASQDTYILHVKFTFYVNINEFFNLIKTTEFFVIHIEVAVTGDSLQFRDDEIQASAVKAILNTSELKPTQLVLDSCSSFAVGKVLENSGAANGDRSKSSTPEGI